MNVVQTAPSVAGALAQRQNRKIIQEPATVRPRRWATDNEMKPLAALRHSHPMVNP
jgi:hypothetical protein